MTDSPWERSAPWTACEYFEIGATASRVELFDGCLLMSPDPTQAHHDMTVRLRNALAESARDNGLHVHHALRLRLGPERVADPDLVIDDGDWGGTFTWASEVTMVGEVVDETTAITDRFLKRQLYAEARIPWYLVVEPSPPDFREVTVRLLRLAGDHYVKQATAEHGHTLKSVDPFPFELHTDDLVAHRPEKEATAHDRM